jgi:hypothetical protein
MEASNDPLDASGETLDRETVRVTRPANCRMLPAGRLTHPTIVGRVRRDAGWRNRSFSTSGGLGDASSGRLDPSGEELDRETRWFLRPASCRMLPAGRVTHPTAFGRIQRDVGRRKRPVDSSCKTPDVSCETGDASNGQLDASGEKPGGETGPVSASDEPPDASGELGDASNGLLDASSKKLDGENGRVSASDEPPNTSGELGDASNRPLDAPGESVYPRSPAKAVAPLSAEGGPRIDAYFLLRQSRGPATLSERGCLCAGFYHVDVPNRTA